MICKSISISEQVNELSDFAALLFTWMIPHADDWGILPGSPKTVKALVIPMRRQGPKDVEKAIKELVSHELIWWYEVDGKQYIQFRTFEKHQEGLHKRTKPKNPAYSDGSGTFPEVPGNSRLIELNRTELNRTEENLKEKDKTALESAIDDFKSFRKKIKAPMTDRAVELLHANLDKLADDDGGKIAILNQSIVNGWKGVFALKDVAGNGNGRHPPEQKSVAAQSLERWLNKGEQEAN